MAVTMRNGLSLSASSHSRAMAIPSLGSPPASFDYLKPRMVSALGSSSFCKDSAPLDLHCSGKLAVKALASYLMPKGQRWWDKSLKPNMVDITCAQQLVDSLENAGDRLVVVGFYSPACAFSRPLHPKVCELAEQYPEAIFLQVNQEKMRPMCEALRVFVLPFFRLYRGMQGRVCSFSCSLPTVKKLQGALAKYGKTDTCDDEYGIGPAKGLEHYELMSLAEYRLIPMDQVSLPKKIEERVKNPPPPPPPHPLISSSNGAAVEEEAAAAASDPALLAA